MLTPHDRVHRKLEARRCAPQDFLDLAGLVIGEPQLPMELNIRTARVDVGHR